VSHAQASAHNKTTEVLHSTQHACQLLRRTLIIASNAELCMLKHNAHCSPDTFTEELAEAAAAACDKQMTSMRQFPSVPAVRRSSSAS
jgi:hypothetical protein